MRGIASVVYLFLSESAERRLAGLNVSLTQDWPGWDLKSAAPTPWGLVKHSSQRLRGVSLLNCRWGRAEPSVWDLWAAYVALHQTRPSSLPVPL